MNIEILRKTAPPVKPVENINLTEPEFFTLDNGIPVYCLNAGDQEVLQLDLNFGFGTAADGLPLAAYFTNLCLKEGTKSYTSRQIAEQLDFYGATINASVTRDHSRLTLYCLNKHLHLLLPLLEELLLAPTFPLNEVKTIVNLSKQEFLVEMEKVKTIARRHFGMAVFGTSHPYGKYAVAEDYDKISHESLLEFYAKYYQSAKFRIIASGRIPLNLNRLLNKHLGQHAVKETLPMAIGPAEPASTKHHFIKKSGSLQSGIAIGKILFNMHHPDYSKMKIVNTIFGGYFGSRLMTNIREDKGYTYGINSVLMSMQYAGMLMIATQTGTEVTRPAVNEIFTEMERLRHEPVPREELDLVKNYMLGLLLQQADGPFAQGELLKMVLDYQLDLSYFQKFINTIKSVTTEEIQDLAVKYLDPNSMISVVVGEG